MGVRGTAPICFSIVLVILSLAGCVWQSDAPGFTYPEPVDPASIFSVSTYGSDSNPGTMQAPWKTIQKAASTLVTGQKVYVMEGIFHERVSVKNSGAPGSPIVFSAYPGARVVIDGRDIGQPDCFMGLFSVTAQIKVEDGGSRRGPRSNLQYQHDLPACPRLHDEFVGRGRFGEGKLLADGWLERAIFQASHNRCMSAYGVVIGDVPEEHAVDCRISSHQLSRVDRYLTAGAYYYDAPAHGQELQVSPQVDVGKHFNNDVKPPAFRQAEGILLIAARAMIQAVMSALLLHELAAPV